MTMCDATPTANAPAANLGVGDATIMLHLKTGAAIIQMCLLSANTQNVVNDSWDIIVQADGSLQIDFNDASGSPISGATAAGAIVANTDYTLVVKFDRDGNGIASGMSYSLNDGVTTVVADISSKATSCDPGILSVGNYADQAYWCTARISQVGVWNRLTTDAEDTEYYNSGLGKYYNEMGAGLKSGCLVFYDLCNGPYSATAQALDSVGTAHLTFTADPVPGTTSLAISSDANLFAGWTESGTVHIETANVRTGAIAARVTWDGGGDDYVSQTGVATIGHTYDFSGYAKSSGADSSVYGGDSSNPAANAVATSASWVNVTGQYTAAATGVIMYPYSATPPTPQVYLDDASLLATQLYPANGFGTAYASDTGSVGTNHLSLVDFTATQEIQAYTTDTHADLTDGYALSLDGVGNYLKATATLGNITSLDFYVKLSVDNQEICTLANSQATAITVAAGVLTFGGSLTASAVTIDSTSYTSDLAAAGVLLNDNAWHHAQITLASVGATDFRIGTDGVGFGQILVDEWHVGTTNIWTFDEGYSGSVGNGDPIFGWIDSNRRLYTQPTFGQRPIFTASTVGLNNRPSVRFDGLNDLLRYAGSLSTASLGTVILCFLTDDTVTTAQTLISSSDEGTTTHYWDLGHGADKKMILNQFDADTTVTANKANTTELVNATAYIFVATSTGTVYAFSLNHLNQTITQVTGTNNGDWLGDTTLRDNLVLGALKTTTESKFFDGYLAEVGLYDVVLTETEIWQAVYMLYRKYGITVTI